MKNLFLSMLAVAGMLMATSCSKEDAVSESSDFVNATFSISTPDGIDTRATKVGDGTTVNYVACAVYDEKDEELPLLRQYRPIDDAKKAQYSIRLVKGQRYRVAFFAYYGDPDGNCAYYNLDDMKNIEIKEAVSNLEKRDAFTNYVDVTAEESMKAVDKNVTLYRPFAQLNLGSYDADIEAAEKAGVVLAQTKIVVSNVYTTFNAFEDKVVGDTSEVTFELNELPGQRLSVDTDNNVSTADETFEYLALNYLLVGDDSSKKSLTDVKFYWEDVDGQTNSPVTVFQNIPVERNYRTNLLGYLLTNPADFNITIDNEFKKPDYNVFYVGGTQTNPEELEGTFEDINDNDVKDAVIKIPAGTFASWTTGAGIGSNPLISDSNSVTKTVTIQGEGENSVLIFDGKGVGAVRAANGATVIFKDITIQDNSESYNEGAWEFTYLEFAGNLEFDNVTFKSGIMLEKSSNVGLNAKFTKCKFISNEDSVYGVWVSDGTSTFDNCKFQGTRGLKMHEDYGSEIVKVEIDGCEFGPLSKKPGIAIGNLNGATEVIVKNSSFIDCQAGDNNNYAYETDTDVATFTFTWDNNKVMIDDKWLVVSADVTIATTADDVLNVFEKGGQIILGDDVSFEKITTIEPGKEVYLNLNEKTITIDKNTKSNTLFYVKDGGKLIIDGEGTSDLGAVSTMAIFAPYGELVINNGTFIRNKITTVTDKTTGLFMGAKTTASNVTINGGYFDSGYYNTDAAEIDDILAGNAEFTETADDVAKRGNSKDANKVRIALKDNVSALLNHSGYGSFKVYGGTFVGANPAWGDEGCMLPTTPKYLRPWSYYQGALLDGQTFNENGIVLPEGYTITKGSTVNGIPTYTVSYSK